MEIKSIFHQWMYSWPKHSNNYNNLPYLFCINLDKMMKFPMNKRNTSSDGSHRICLVLSERRRDLLLSGGGDLCIKNLQLHEQPRRVCWHSKSCQANSTESISTAQPFRSSSSSSSVWRCHTISPGCITQTLGGKFVSDMHAFLGRM